ncbi:MAG: hypothetical protein AAGA37_19960 [Actinomycetota bacterium]
MADRFLPVMMHSLLTDLSDEAQALLEVSPERGRRFAELADDLRAAAEAARMFEVVS